MDVKLFLAEHVPVVLEFEQSLMPPQLSPIEREMRSWDSSWRKESLEHYAQLGWSFVLYDQDRLVGYLLGQPLLYFNQWAQSLWIERVSAISPQGSHQLLDTAIRWARTKHLQKVLLNEADEGVAAAKGDFPLDEREGHYRAVSTTKMMEGSR